MTEPTPLPDLSARDDELQRRMTEIDRIAGALVATGHYTDWPTHAFNQLVLGLASPGNAPAYPQIDRLLEAVRHVLRYGRVGKKSAARLNAALNFADGATPDETSASNG